MKKKHLLSAVLFFLATCLFAKEGVSFYADFHTGCLNSNIKEILLNKEGNDAKTSSLLDWQIYASPFIQATAGVRIKSNYFIRMDGMYVLPFSTGKMQDYDWMNLFSTGNSELTHYSTHQNKVDSFYNGQLSLGIGGYVTPKIEYISFFSFRYSYLSFTSHNGYRQYGQNIGSQNGSAVYESWKSSIEKKELSGKIITLEEENYFFGIGSQINFRINDRLNSILFLQILPSIQSHALDTHHRRNTKYTLFDSDGKLAFDSSFLLQYKLKDCHRFNLKAACCYSIADNINLYQSASKSNWMGVSNPGKLSSIDFSFAVGYAYYYEK